MGKVLFVIFFIFFATSCDNNNTKYNHEVLSIVKKWTGKTICAIPSSNYIIYSKHNKQIEYPSQNRNSFKILLYINESESESCRLHLYEWADFFKEVDSISKNVDKLIIVKPKNKFAFIQTLQDYNFIYPVYIDEKDEFNTANKLPSNTLYHQFLLDKNNVVIFIGNPINSRKIRKAYISIINGKKNIERNTEENKTKCKLSTTSINLGTIEYKKTRKANVVIRNIGETPLIIQDIQTGCGCIQINYDKKPIPCGDSSNIIINYHAISTGIINKNIKIFCNTNTSYNINIKGIVKP